MSAKTGGPAFPNLYVSSPEPGDYRTMAEGGMTLRDYFAAKAMQKLDHDANKDWLAMRAYEIADAMLEARK